MGCSAVFVFVLVFVLVFESFSMLRKLLAELGKLAWAYGEGNKDSRKNLGRSAGSRILECCKNVVRRFKKNTAESFAESRLNLVRSVQGHTPDGSIRYHLVGGI